MGIDVTPYEATLKNHTIDPIRTGDNFPLPKKGSFAPISEQRMWSIRQLTDNYYDMQKMRIKTFNNVIAWIKSNPDKAKDYLKSSDKEEDSGKEEWEITLQLISKSNQKMWTILEIKKYGMNVNQYKNQKY